MVWKMHLLKMCILSKYLYLFQALPIQTPPHYFKQVHSLFTKFIWAHKKSQLPRRQLSLPRPYGGLALLDVWKYYHATHLGKLIDWSRRYNAKLWTQLVQAQTDIPLKGALCCFDNLPPVLKAHPLLGTMLRICLSTVFSTFLSTHASPLLPILRNPGILPWLWIPGI